MIRILLLSLLLFVTGCAKKEPPKVPRAEFTRRYQSAMKKGDTDLAQEVLLEAMELYPQEYDFRMDMGRIYEEAGFTRNALRSYYAANKIKPNEVSPLFRMALVERYQRHFEKAEDHLLAAIALDEKNPSLHNNLGIIYVAQERYRDATEEFQISLNYDQNNPNTILNMGLILAKTETSDSTAVKLIANYITNNPGSKQLLKLQTILENLRKRAVGKIK